jgi:hypothetical protein
VAYFFYSACDYDVVANVQTPWTDSCMHSFIHSFILSFLHRIALHSIITKC